MELDGREMGEDLGGARGGEGYDKNMLHVILHG